MSDLTTISWDQISLEVDPQDSISENFRVYELTKSETADRLLIDNSFNTLQEIQSAVYVCRNVLQAIRGKFGAFSPNSVFRCQELERALKEKPASWISDSQHTKGQACDVEIPGVTTIDLAKWVAENLEFDQVICECFNPAKGPNSGWVHVSLVPPGIGTNRRKKLSYVMNPETGGYSYVDGFQESA